MPKTIRNKYYKQEDKYMVALGKLYDRDIKKTEEELKNFEENNWFCRWQRKKNKD